MNYRHPACLALASILLTAAAHSEERSQTRLPEMIVRAPSEASGLREEQPADQTGRPEWTSHRRFTTTRVYIQKAPWEVGIEQWWRYRDLKDGTSKSRFQEEIEIGLPYRFQLDLYLDWTSDDKRNADLEDFAFELRWAMADWGKIPLNPTLYAEYKVSNHGPNVFEGKLLLGEQIAPRLHWGANLVYERELRASRTTELQATQGISYTVIDEAFSIGAEMKYVYETEQGGRGTPTHKFLVGPSLQVRPTKNTHLDLVGLIGTNEDSPNLEAFVVFGIDFGNVGSGGDKRGYAPVSLRSN